jgi:sulfate adenylyltransferase subunit 1
MAGAGAAQRGVVRFITCGSVDDGKSTLIGRLLHDTRAVLRDQLAAVASASRRRGLATLDFSLLTDGLEAERAQGITIDVAWRYFCTPRRKFIIADTPGHEQYTRNMVTAASTADAAVILLDATRGLRAQSRRHLLIAHLLGIRHLIVAVNKLDLVGYSREPFEALREQFERAAARVGAAAPRFIPISALHGDMVVERGARLGWYEGPTLLEALEAIAPLETAAALPLRFPVQLVCREGARALMGRVAAGTARPGMEVVALPSGRRTRIRDVRLPDRRREQAAAGDSAAIVLEDELDVARGDMIADAGCPPRPARSFEARLCWLAEEPLDPRSRYALKHTTRTLAAKFASLESRVDVDTLEPRPVLAGVGANDIFRARLAAHAPLFADAYARCRATGAFILMDEATHRTVAAGMIE